MKETNFYDIRNYFLGYKSFLWWWTNGRLVNKWIFWFTGWVLEWHATWLSNVNVCFFFQINWIQCSGFVLSVYSLYISIRYRRILSTDAAVLQLWHQFKVHLNLCIIRHLLSSLYHLLLLLTSQLPLVLTEVDTQWSARGERARCVCVVGGSLPTCCAD